MEDEWRNLAESAQGVTPFQYPEWILPWYEVWAADRVHLLTARDDRGALRAVVPMVIHEGRLELAGGGVGDYLAPVVADPAQVPALDDALSRVGLPIRFNDVPVDAVWVSAVRNTSRWKILTSSPCPVAPLSESSSTWRRSLPPGLRRNLRRYWQRLSDEANARFETIARDERRAPAAVQALVGLHTSRWHERGLPGVLNDDRVRRFHTLAAPPLMRSGLLRLHLLYAGSDVIGAQDVLVRGSRAYSYLGGFDPSWNAYSPGTLLMAYAIEQAIGEGCTEFDFLRGREAYKYKWGAIDRCSLSLWRDAVS
jgi:CelD/BcsL family acetyltransferase involved in cellulose biosynthesis